MLHSFRRRVADALRSGSRLEPDGGADVNAARPDPVVDDLARKLRAGFSRHACKDLDAIVRGEHADQDRKMRAAWELAKFHAVVSQWDEVLRYCAWMHAADAAFLRRHHGGPLYVDALLALGRREDAERLALELLDDGEVAADPAGLVDARSWAAAAHLPKFDTATVAPARSRRREHYDLVVVSDLTLLGGTRRCNEGYIAAAKRLGLRVALFHWPRYDLRLKDDIAPEYRALHRAGDVDLLAATDRASAGLTLIHHPPILKVVPDVLPSIETRHLAILVNQLPWRCGEPGAYYERADVEAFCSGTFDVPAVWIPISPVVRRVLAEAGFGPLAKEDWIPPLGNIVPVAERARPAGRARRHPVIGRHSRDHWTKWPEAETDLRRAYCADAAWPVRFLGGASAARKVLERWPRNWEELAFDSVAVGDFLRELDVFVHYTHSAYVEEFGRNVMEAMAAGVPAVLPARFREVFGDAACYAEPGDVGDAIRALWQSPSARAEQVEKGLHFVEQTASNACVERRLAVAVDGALEPATAGD